MLIFSWIGSQLPAEALKPLVGTPQSQHFEAHVGLPVSTQNDSSQQTIEATVCRCDTLATDTHAVGREPGLMIKSKVRRFLVGLVWLTLWVTTAHAQSENAITLTAEDWDHLRRTCPMDKDECRERVLKFSYFPPGTLHLVRHATYSGYLAAMEEPVLSENKNPGFEIYRLLYLRENNILVVRVQIDNGAQMVVVKEPASIESTYKLTSEEWGAIFRLVDEADYWHLAPSNDRLGLHGWTCLLEGVRDGRYHVVERWSPDGEDLPFQKVCEYLQSLKSHRLIRSFWSSITSTLRGILEGL